MRSERQAANQRALEGMRTYLPTVFGGMCRATMTSVDGRVAQLRKEILKGDAVFRKERKMAMRNEW